MSPSQSTETQVYLVWKYEYEGDTHLAIYAKREDAEAHKREYAERFGHGFDPVNIDSFDLLTTFDPERVREFGSE